MKTVVGNLIELANKGQFDVIIHGCNCFCNMGSGIAPQIKSAYPAAWDADKNTLKGEATKLGNYTSAHVKVGDHKLIVVNAYTQFTYGSKPREVSYDAMDNVFSLVAKDFDGMRIGYPLIGGDRGGGDWNVISAIINGRLEGQDHTLVEYDNS